MSNNLHSTIILRNVNTITPEISPDFNFHEVIPSFIISSKNLSYTAEIQLKTVSERISKWLYIGSWNRTHLNKILNDGSIKSKIDVISSSEALKSCKIRILTDDDSLNIEMISISFSHNAYKKNTNFHDSFIPKSIFLDVPFRSQMIEDDNIKMRICSPTSVCAVMEYFNKKIETSKFAMEIYDPEYDMFGVWWRAIQGAKKYGFNGYVRHFKSLEEAYIFLKKGIPVICCISYEKEELKDSHTERTDGHVLTLCGFTDDKKAICCDSAAPKEFGKTFYDLEEFRKSWLYSGGGTGYIITPEKERIQ